MGVYSQYHTSSPLLCLQFLKELQININNKYSHNSQLYF